MLNQSLRENELLQKKVGDLGRQLQLRLCETRCDDPTLLDMAEDEVQHEWKKVLIFSFLTVFIHSYVKEHDALKFMLARAERRRVAWWLVSIMVVLLPLELKGKTTWRRSRVVHKSVLPIQDGDGCRLSSSKEG